MKTVLISAIVPLVGSDSGHYILNCARYLLKQGYKVVVVSASNDLVTINNEIRSGHVRREMYSDIVVEDLYYPHGELADFPSFSGHFIQHHHFTFHKMNSKQMNTYINYLSESIKRLITEHEPEFILASHVAPLPGIVAEMFELNKELTPIPVVPIAFGAACNCSLADEKKFADPTVYERLFVDYMKRGQEYAAKTIATSNLVKKDLKKLGFDEADIIVAPDGYDPEIYSTLKQEIDDYQLVLDTQQELFQEYNSHLLTSCCAEYRKNFSSDYLGRLYSVIHDGNIFMFTDCFVDELGGNNYSLGVERLIGAVKKLKEKFDGQFCVIVYGNGLHIHKVIQEVYARKLDNIFFIGYQSQPKVINRWYNLASASIMTSYSERQFAGLLECAATGTPTVVSDDKGYQEVATKLDCQVITDYPNELAAVMNQSIEENWAEQVIKKNSFLQNRSWARIIDKINKDCIDKL